jgi:O-antigen ligase
LLNIWEFAVHLGLFSNFIVLLYCAEKIQQTKTGLEITVQIVVFVVTLACIFVVAGFRSLILYRELQKLLREED